MGNTNAQIAKAKFKSIVKWSDIIAVIPDPENRSYALQAFRDAGFSADSFGHERMARELVAEGLTRLEDQLELRGSPKLATQRLAIREVRRRLELELWP